VLTIDCRDLSAKNDVLTQQGGKRWSMLIHNNPIPAVNIKFSILPAFLVVKEQPNDSV
jgi:hypothetical protein